MSLITPTRATTRKPFRQATDRIVDNTPVKTIGIYKLANGHAACQADYIAKNSRNIAQLGLSMKVLEGDETIGILASAAIFPHLPEINRIDMLRSSFAELQDFGFPSITHEMSGVIFTCERKSIFALLHNTWADRVFAQENSSTPHTSNIMWGLRG